MQKVINFHFYKQWLEDLYCVQSAVPEKRARQDDIGPGTRSRGMSISAPVRNTRAA
jgi:hypothetical protein